MINLKYKGEPSTLSIGANCIIREGVTMNPGTEGGGMITSVGDNCAFLANSHIGHDCRVGNNVIMSNGALIAGHCTVGDFAILGGGAGVLQFSRIGAHSFLGGMSALFIGAILSNNNPKGKTRANGLFGGGLIAGKGYKVQWQRDYNKAYAACRAGH